MDGSEGLPEGMNPPSYRGVGEEDVPKTAEEAFDELVATRYARLVSTIRVVTRDHAVAEDIVQESFARAYLAWPKLWPDGNPAGWIHRVAMNLAISWRRRLGREIRAVSRLGRRAPMYDEQPDVHPELERAVAELPVRQRTALSLYYVLGLPIDEVAEVMGCRPGTVKSLLFQARGRLRETLGEQ